jgi:hypothetical protein
MADNEALQDLVRALESPVITSLFVSTDRRNAAALLRCWANVLGERGQEGRRLRLEARRPDGGRYATPGRHRPPTTTTRGVVQAVT